MADIIRRQMRAVGLLQALAPVMDVARDARWGRVSETYGEDPSPARIICAIPRASLRSVLLICACKIARMCRVSTQMTGKFASPSAL
jgi:Glycosyl hydrolase family 3 N terminal domain